MTLEEAQRLLGLSAGASDLDIKRAFRRLAMKWHPDRNSAPESAETFRRLRAAHDSLLGYRSGDSELRDEETAAEYTTAENSADDRARRSSPRAPNREIDFEVSVEEAFLGCIRPVRVEEASPCPDCDGRGSKPSPRGHLCVDCHGSGRLRVADGLKPCEACDGKGYRYRVTCPSCDGLGRAIAAREVEVVIPGGSRDADVLRVEGEGATADGLANGDLLITVRVAPHALYRIVGNDLVLERPVGALRMLLGGRIRIPHPKGDFTLVLEAGPAVCREWCIRGEGWPERGGIEAGDLRIRLVPVMPRELDPSLRDILAPIADLIDKRAAQFEPEVHAWESRWLS